MSLLLRDNILHIQVEEIPDARKKIRLFGFAMPKRGPVKAVKKMLLPRDSAPYQFDQLGSGFEDRLEVFRPQSEKQTGSDSLYRCIGGSAGQKGNLAESVAWPNLLHLQDASIRNLSRHFQDTIRNELDRLQFCSLY